MNPILDDENAMLKVYRRRLQLADNKFEKGKAERQGFLARYANEPENDQVTEEGHLVSVTSGIGIIDTMYSGMTAVDIEFLVKNIGNGSRLQALATTAALNQAWRDAKGQRRAKDAVKDAVLVDIGWIKCYYDYAEEPRLRDRPAQAVEAEIATMAAQRNIDPDDIPREEIELAETVTVVVRDRICIEYMPWDMIRCDPSAKRVEDIRWVCQYTSMPVYEVQNNPVWAEFVTERYGVTRGRELLDSIKGDTSIDTYIDAELMLGVDKDEYADDRRVTICEMWDFETGIAAVFPKSMCDIVLHERANPLMINAELQDRSPFKPLIVRKDSRSLEGIGDMRVIFPALQELDEYRNNLATYISRTIPKLIGPEEGLTQKGKNALKSPVWGELVGTAGVDGNAYTTLTPPALPSEAFQIQDKIALEMRDGTGVSEPARGVFPSKRTTATEVKTVTERGDMRQSERRGALEEWYIDIANCMLQLMQTYYDRDRMLTYINDLGDEFKWEWNASDIATENDILVSITPKEALTRDDRVQRFLLLMNLALPLPESDRAEFVRRAAEEMGYRNDEISALVKSADEVQAENQLQQANTLAAAPQPSAGSPPGLTLTPGA